MSKRQPIPGVGAHARDRMAERLGRDLTREEWLDAVERLTGGQLARLCLTPNGSEHYLHELGGVALRLVWRPDLGMVVTVLPADMPPSVRLRKAREFGVRTTIAVCAKYRRGKRLAARTCRVPPELRE